MNDQPNNPESSQPAPAPGREAALFDAVLQLPRDQRAAYLAQACGDDAQLRQRLEKLLASNDTASSFLEPAVAPPPPGKTINLSFSPTEKAGDRIGRYKLLQQIGEGGCGVVYMAEQEEPVRRRVALKVIKLGMDTKSVIARFEAERQALAMMDHPNIAKVLDAGSTENGRPFFVMELVRGIKITDYCDQNKLSTDERLKLFIQICHAIQHAHQKGIIHRDIKPSNILVTLHDGVPVPKVIDFGIAKATQGRLTDQTLFTAFEQFIGTPAYMSPEQAEMSGLDIDTRSDIYSLGVLLYELLTGKTPFDSKELIASGLDAMRHTIREKEPERPSTRLSTMLNADLTNTATHRRTDAPKLIHLLRGDLDWIVMKALEKDRTRRFETANGLAVDVQRYLQNEPVTARPPSTAYRFQKLIRRNKTIFAAVGTGIAALIIGLALSLYLFIQERTARQRAVAAEKAQERMRQEAERYAEMGNRTARAGFLLTRGQYAEAEELVKDIPPHSTMIAFYNVFGQVHAARAQWPAALSNLNLSMQVLPNDYASYHSVAPLLLQVGDVDGYRRHRATILHRFADTSDAVIAERLAKDCLILPPAADEIPAINKLVAVAVAAGTNHVNWGYIQFAKGLSEYRQGNFAGAVEWLQGIAAQRDYWDRTVQANMVLAMSQYSLNQHEDARATLSKGLKIADEKLEKLGKENIGDEWNDWIIAHQLMREAQSVIDPQKLATSSKIQQEREQADTIATRAMAEGRQSQWRQALADFIAAEALDPDVQQVWFEHAAVLLQLDDLAGYRAHRQSLLTRLGKTTDQAVSRRLAKACLLIPGTDEEMAACGRLADAALDKDSEWRESSKVFAEYRQGHYTNAVEWSKQAFARPPNARRDSQLLFIVAMSHQKLNHPDEARAALAKGIDTFNTAFPNPSGDLGPGWVDCIIGQMLLREARVIIPDSPNSK